MAMTPIWEASPPPPEDWGDDANAEWPVLGIVSEEINAVGNKLYEVKWGQWHRPDGTNTTWETEESMDDMVALRRAWDERQARKRAEAAARSSSMDIRVDPELLWHQDATVEVAQAYEEKKARWMARSLAKYQGWDDIEQMSDGSGRDDKSDDAQGSGGDERSRSRGSRFDEDSDQEDQEDESDDDDGDGDPRPRSTSAATHLRPLSARSLLSKSTKTTPRVATPLHTHNQSESSIPKWPRPSSVSRPPPQRLTSTFPVSPPVTSAFVPILSAPRTARPIKPLPQRKRQIIRSASPEFRDETVDRCAELKRSWTGAAKRSGAAFVTFVNEVNQEEVPPNLDGFQYCENYYVRVPGVPYSDETINCLVSCECTALCEDAGTCGCQGPSELVNDDGEKEFAYTDKGLFRFNLPPGVEVIECNKNCSCRRRACPNRVAQQPRNVPIEVFRTRDCGWGARATIDLAKGKVVGIYTGELIPRKEACALTGDRKSYIFDLDVHEGGSDDDDDEQERYSVDGYRHGNWTRFINHSCEPNMCVYPVVWDSIPELNQPYLAFATMQEIPARTELTIDYDPKAGAAHRKGKGKGKSKMPPGARKCTCGTESCRGWVRV